MGSTPNFNPPASSVAVHAPVYCPGMWAGDPRTGENSDPERGTEQVKCVPDRTEVEFHGTFDRRGALERTRQPGERIGVMVEDRSAVEESTAASSEGHAREWRHAMAEKFFSQRGAGREETVSGELIEQGHDEEGDRAAAEHLAHPPVRAGASQREHDWAWCLEALRRGLDPAIVLAWKRAGPGITPTRKTTRGAPSRARHSIASARDAGPGDRTLTGGVEPGRTEGKRWLSIISM